MVSSTFLSNSLAPVSMSSRFWYGPQMTRWAERWVPYWTGGKGVFAMSAEEDTGVMQALTPRS